MAKIRQRQVLVEVTSADPINKVFKGIYGDAEYTSLLTTSKSYGFPINSGEYKNLFIRYSPVPVTLTFSGTKGLTIDYQVSGSFGTIEVGDINVDVPVEFPSDSATSMDIEITSIIMGGKPIQEVTIGAETFSLPYTITGAAPSAHFTIQAPIDQSTRTTTTSTSTSTTTSSTTSSSTPYQTSIYFAPIGSAYSIDYSFNNDGIRMTEHVEANTGVTIKVPHNVEVDGLGKAVYIYSCSPDNIYLFYVEGITIDTSSTVHTLPTSISVHYGEVATIKPVLKTKTTTTPAPMGVPAQLSIKSNVGGTVVEVTPENLDTEEVSLAGTTASHVTIDMSDAPIVDV